MKRTLSIVNHTLAFGALLFVSACSTFTTPLYKVSQTDGATFSQPLREPNVPPKEISETTELKQDRADGIEVRQAPVLTIKNAAQEAATQITPSLKESQVTRLGFNDMPVAAFINEVFSNQLSLDYILEPGIREIDDLVTMRLNSSVSQKDLYDLATRTLRSYGVTTSLKDNVLFFSYSAQAAGNEVPLLITGRALPDVPVTNRPIFYIYPLQALSTPMLRGALVQMFPTKDLTISEDASRNALVFRGSQILVNQAVQATRLLDLPTMRGMQSRVFRPHLSTVTELAANLESVLQTQGYAVRQGKGIAAIRLLPLESVNQLVVFTQSAEVLEHVISWAKTLEEEKYGQVEYGLFSYQVQSTSAAHIVDIIQDLGLGVAVRSGTTNSTSGTLNQETSTAKTTSDESQNRLAIDEQLNTILFSGRGKDWLQALPIIQDLDRPAPSVMVEVILAEVQLNDSEQSGIEWLANSSADRFGLNFGTLSGLGVGGTGFRLTLDNAGQTRALLNLFYKNEKAVIRSRPRLMVKSGGAASIDVGNEIPIITTNTQSLENPNSPVIQNITYRKTGVLLDVEPIVHASGFVEIKLKQELSEATATSSSDIDSPTILNRSLSTVVTLQDGGSVLIGGLIASNSSEGNQGLPVLSRIPLIKEFFSGGTNDQSRTELMVMIIPYILSTPEKAMELTDELQRVRMKILTQ